MSEYTFKCDHTMYDSVITELHADAQIASLSARLAEVSAERDDWKFTFNAAQNVAEVENKFQTARAESAEALVKSLLLAIASGRKCSIGSDDELTAARAEIERLKYERDDHKQAAWVMSGRPGRFSDHDDCKSQSALLKKAQDGLAWIAASDEEYAGRLKTFARTVLLELENTKGSEGR